MGVGVGRRREVTRGCSYESREGMRPVPTGFARAPWTSNYNVKALSARRGYPGFP